MKSRGSPRRRRSGAARWRRAGPRSFSNIARRNNSICGSEVVGLIPLEAILLAAEYYMQVTTACAL
jgi:hypothetical protein